MSSTEHKTLMSIDMGTYGFFAAFANPANINEARPIGEWPGKPDGVHYDKIKNGILLSKSKPDRILGFGWQAHQNYLDAKEAKDPEFEDMAYFENFKLQLLQSGDIFDAGKHIFSVGRTCSRELCSLVTSVLGEIKKHSLEFYRNRIGTVEDHEVFWILTVPVEWSLHSIESMKRCCEQIDISRENLLIVKEPEAAGNYLIWGTREGQAMPVGSKFVVLDCGSGTFDLVAQEIIEVEGERQLKDIHHADGGLFGAVNVDEAFVVSVLSRVFGARTMERFQEENPADFVEQMIQFQAARERVKMGEKKKKIQISPILRELAEEEEIDFEGNAASYVVSGKENVLKFKAGVNKLEVHDAVWRHLHAEVVETIIEKTQEVIENCEGVDRLFLVGGFSQSSFISTNVRRMLDDLEEDGYSVQFEECKRPELAVTMGALWAAQGRVDSRQLKVSYGLAVDREWTRRHADRKEPDPSFPSGFKAPGCFDQLFTKGDEYKVGLEETRKFPLRPGQQDIEIAVYQSTEDITDYIDEECCKSVPPVIWSYEIEPGVVSAQEQTLCISFKFGEDCLKCGVYVEKAAGGDSHLREFMMNLKGL